MNRRRFLSTSAAGMTSTASYAAPFADQKPKRVGMIGCGWYAKSDLFRLIQVAPVEGVSLCDVDKRVGADCADMGAGRQASKKNTRPVCDNRGMLKQEYPG